MSRSDPPDNVDAGREWAQADLATGNGIAAAVRGIKVIVHAASNPYRGRLRATDVEGTRRLLAAARREGISNFVYVSIVGVDKIPFFYYRVKHEVERLVEESGVPFTISRSTQFHAFVDNGFRAAARMPFVLPLPRGLRAQSIDTGDYADYLLQYVDQAAEGRIADAGGPQLLAAEAMARPWLAASGTRRRLLTVPAGGKIIRAYREGHHTAPDRAVGNLTWEEWLGRKYGDLIRSKNG
jgi:uncharacterized protein YbjT (DUF2867 family)